MPSFFRVPPDFSTSRNSYIWTTMSISFTSFMNTFGVLWEGEPEEIKPLQLP
jgi:hypothetical protein